MRLGQRVRACEIPHQILTAVPRIESGAVGPLPIAATKKTRGLQLGVHVYRPDSSDDDIVGQSVAPDICMYPEVL